MFNRSLKYIVLVIVNLIVLYFFVYEGNEDNKVDDVIFDANYVEDLLVSNENFKANIEKLDKENALFSESIDKYKREISQTNSNLKTSSSDLASCNSQKNILINLSERQATDRTKNKSDQVISQLQCSDNLVKLELVNLQIGSLQKQIKHLNNENSSIMLELSESNIKIDKLNRNVDKFESNKSGYLEVIDELRDDLNSSIYVKKFYVTPRYCEGTKYKDVICLDEVLLMTNFSKPPFTDVLVKLKDPRGRVIGELTYNPQNAKIVNFPFPNKAEFLKGDFEISFEVDNLLFIEKQSFRQE
jgi:hypothetical protein